MCCIRLSVTSNQGFYVSHQTNITSDYVLHQTLKGPMCHIRPLSFVCSGASLNKLVDAWIQSLSTVSCSKTSINELHAQDWNGASFVVFTQRVNFQHSQYSILVAPSHGQYPHTNPKSTCAITHIHTHTSRTCIHTFTRAHMHIRLHTHIRTCSHAHAYAHALAGQEQQSQPTSPCGVTDTSSNRSFRQDLCRLSPIAAAANVGSFLLDLEPLELGMLSAGSYPR